MSASAGTRDTTRKTTESKKSSKGKSKKKDKDKVLTIDTSNFPTSLLPKGSYENVNIKYEFLNVSNRSLGMDGVIDIIRDLSDDTVIKHVNASNNIKSHETKSPQLMVQFMNELEKSLSMNKTITALDLASNNLFGNSEHPLNEHLGSYVIQLTDIISKTRLSHIDLSDNDICGGKGKMLKGIGYMGLHYISTNCRAFTAKSSNLYGPGYVALCSSGLGITSSLTYLDLSYNYGGLSPFGTTSSDGMMALAGQLSRTLFLRILRISHNHFNDDDMCILGDAINALPRLQLLDISGNYCHSVGCKGISYAVNCHSTLETWNREGLVDLDMSHNPLGYQGIVYLCAAIERSSTLLYLRLRDCMLDNESMKELQIALCTNYNIIYLDISDNLISAIQQAYVDSEVIANRYLVMLKDDHLSIDCNLLTAVNYTALAKKLRFLSSEVLLRVHQNATFTETDTEMCRYLYLSQPPSRHVRLKDVLSQSTNLQARFKESLLVQKKLDAIKLIFKTVMRWYVGYAKAKRIKESLLEARLKQENALVIEDD